MPFVVIAPVKVPPDLLSFLPNAELITLFCTGLVELLDNAVSTVIFVAPDAIPSSLLLSEADIKPSELVVTTASAPISDLISAGVRQ